LIAEVADFKSHFRPILALEQATVPKLIILPQVKHPESMRDSGGDRG
jgi:hypothetical protein